ncbi:uncharacterized protein METZ01_LOCUS443363, partial [marine metagenome]
LHCCVLEMNKNKTWENNLNSNDYHL